MGPDGQAGVRVDALLHTAQTGHALRQLCLNNLHAKGPSMSTRLPGRQRMGKLLLEELFACCISHVGNLLPGGHHSSQKSSGRNAGLSLPKGGHCSLRACPSER